VAASARTRRQMTALVRQWEAGSEPRQAFARRHGLTVGCFDYWKRRLRDAAPSAPRVTFAPVQVVSDPAPLPTAAIELVLISGERLTIPAGVSSAHLRVVLAALRAPC
jgi:hypothetical protein